MSSERARPAPPRPRSIGGEASWLALIKALLLSALAAISPTQAIGESAVAPSSLKHLNHRAYTLLEGASGDGYATAQTLDGTLWIGGTTGLSRFDGLNFVAYPFAEEDALPFSNISALSASHDGGLWIGYRLGGVSFLKNGRLKNYGSKDGLPEGTVGQFAWDPSGSLWMVSRGQLLHFDGVYWHRIDIGSVEATGGLLIDRRGAIWVPTLHSLLARAPGSSDFHEVRRMDFVLGMDPPVLAEAPDGKIWAAGRQETIRVNQPATFEGIVPVKISGFDTQIGELMFDPDGNLWIGSGQRLGEIYQISAAEATRDAAGGLTLTPEAFSFSDNLSSRATAILLDKEGDIWVTTPKGIERFSRSNVVNAPVHCTESGLAAGADNALWMACLNSEELYELRNGTDVRRVQAPPTSALYQDPHGVVWLGGATYLGHVENERIVTTRLPESLQGVAVQAMASDLKGNLWVSIVRKGVYRVAAGEWDPYGGVSTMPRGPAIVIVSDAKGTIWFGYPGSRVARLQNEEVTVFDSRAGLTLGNIGSILVKDAHVWVGGESGLAYLKGDQFVPIHFGSGTPLRGISGIVQSRSGDLWLNGIDGIARIPKDEVERIHENPSYSPRYDHFNYLDGVPGTATQLRPQPSAIEAMDGQLWFSLNGGAVSIDVSHLLRNNAPPPVTIWSLASGRRTYANTGSVLALPLHTTNMRIDYSAGSLIVPERVRFRYRLEGFDKDWQDVGRRREAVYTNLGPGHYTFQVIASNNDGVWNNRGASLQFDIPPAFYQMRWFYALCAFVAIAFLLALYRLRIRQVAALVRGRWEVRLAERERIARELHDTLFQDIQGLLLAIDNSTNTLTDGHPTRTALKDVLLRSDLVMSESRRRVLELRADGIGHKRIGQALTELGNELAKRFTPMFHVVELGTPQSLHPVVFEEVFRVCSEALINAFQHADAKKIEVEILFARATFSVRIRDDGVGIDETVLTEGGRPGHFGLKGMAERARRIGARFTVRSKRQTGTEIEISLPRKFLSPGAHWYWPWTRAAGKPWAADLTTGL